MESKAKLFGHPIHPMLIVLPLGLFLMAVFSDAAYLVTGNITFAAVAYWDISAGIAGGLLAAVFGFIDWWAIPSGTRAKSIGLYHGVGNVIVVVLFLVSCLMRYRVEGYIPSMTASVLIFAGIVLGAVTGWLGGELVDRLGVGVDEGAHLDAPSSMSGRSARSGAR
ncbi:MAG: hypothetical protein DMF84_25650 [Acidobacteria bacterium]|nr:MAG: hypothetical protein DMF84_25650 [Acidobacteriota bacterium]